MPWTHDSKPVLITKGPLILSLESLFFHWQRYPKRRVAPATPPLHEQAMPRELEQPYRIGHGHVFRFPLTRRGFVVGYWVPASGVILEEEESQHLMDAVEGAMIPGITATEIATWSRGRLTRWQRFRAWLIARWDAVASTEVAKDLGWTTMTEKMEHSDVIPWDDGKVYNLEDARVNLGEAQ